MRDRNGRAHKPAGLPQGEAGTFDDEHAARGDGDLDMPMFDKDARIGTLIEDRIPLDPARTGKVPVLDASDSTAKGRVKLARYIWTHLDPDADMAALAGRAVLERWPDATPYDGVEAMAVMRRLQSKGYPESLAWKTGDGRLIIVGLGPHKPGAQGNYRFRSTHGAFTQTSLADLLAADRIADASDGMDEPVFRRLLEDTRRNYVDPLGAWHLDVGDGDQIAALQSDLGLTDIGPAPEDKDGLAAWCDESERRLDALPDSAPYMDVSVYRMVVANRRRLLERYDMSKACRDGLARVFDSEANVMANRRWARVHASGRSATVWTDKKHRDPAHVAASEHNPFKRAFGYMEVDDDVDLDRFAALGAEYERYRRLLPASRVKPDLRFRYAGRHHASGLYAPDIRTMVVDPRSPSSFTHEWFHHLDATTDMHDVSLDPAFTPILDHYRATVDRTRMGGADPDRWLAPTEVFARAAETWMSRHGGDGSSLLDSRATYDSAWDYAPFKDIREDVDRFFDDRFARA